MELIATIIITAASVLLFGYWFRYTCMLILSAKTNRDFVREVAAFNELNFGGVQVALEAATPDLERLRAALDSDFAVLSRMMEQTKHLTIDDAAIEQRMLQMHYKASRMWFNLVGRLSSSTGRRALEDMSSVVAHFANLMGERVAAAA